MIAERLVSFPGTLAEQMAALWAHQSVEWPRLVQGIAALRNARIRAFDYHGARIVAQSNPARIVSAAAKVDAATLATRPCFLCPANLPIEQLALLYREQWLILSNPAPIFEPHFTVVITRHEPQRIAPAIETVLEIARELEHQYTILYNGPKCGASAPDHLHLQAARLGQMPVEHALAAELNRADRLEGGWFKWIRAHPVRVGVSRPDRWPLIVLQGSHFEHVRDAFFEAIEALGEVHPSEPEPMFNLLCFYTQGSWVVCIFPRAAHRPACYGTAADQFLISPGSADVAGILITPRSEDMDRLTSQIAGSLLDEVLLPSDKLARVAEQLA